LPVIGVAIAVGVFNQESIDYFVQTQDIRRSQAHIKNSLNTKS